MNLDKIVENAKMSTSSEMMKIVDDVLDMLIDERKKANDEALFYLPSKWDVTIVGDIHGDLKSLYLILNHSKFLERKRDYLVFLGDYGDRGLHSPEVYYVVLSLKRDFSDRVVLLRGNHEGPRDVEFWPHDLPDRLIEKYGRREGSEIYRRLYDIFDNLHNGAIVEEKYILLHGGLPTQISSLKDIAVAHKIHPHKSDLIEILWNDPDDKIEGSYPNWQRGIGRIFGKDVTDRILKLIGVKTLIRSHQPPHEGVRVNHDGRILTISSTTVYGGRSSYLKLDLSEKGKSAHDLSKIVHIF